MSRSARSWRLPPAGSGRGRPGRVRVQDQVELVAPAELEAGAGQASSRILGAGVPLGEVGGVGGDLVGDHACLDVFAVGQAEVLLGRDVAEHRGADQPIIAAPMALVMWS